jgi:hypothetical protein
MAPSDSLSYRVVFDASRQLPQGWWGFVAPLAIATVLIRLGPRNRMNQSRLFRGVFVGFAIVLATAIAALTWTTYYLVRQSLEHGNYRLVEGTVAEFNPEQSMIKRPESFIVVSPAESTRYSYSRAIGTQGLNNSHGHIRNGVRVRIADVDGKIARLEVAKQRAQE